MFLRQDRCRQRVVRAEALESRRLLAATYYVSPTGNDADNGRTPATAWQTIDRVNAKRYRPGDQILFQGGQRFAVSGTRGPNVAVNGDFEQAFAGWEDTMGTPEGNSTLVTDPALIHAGAASLKLGTGSAARAQDVTSLMTPNQTYEIAAWTRRNRTDSGLARVGVTFYYNSHKLGTFYRGFSNTTWQETRFSFVAPTGFNRAVMWCAKTTDTSSLYIDDVALSTLPNGIVLDANDSGTAALPVRIGTYGTKKPAKISAGDGNGITLVNASNVTIQNMLVVGTWNALTGSGTSAGEGIDLVSSRPGDVKLPNIRIISVESKGFRWAGIRVGGWNVKSGFTDVLISKSRVRWNGDNGIYFRGEFDKASTGYAHTNVWVTRCRISNNTGIPGRGANTGNGLLVSDVDGATIERNIAWENGSLNNYAAGGPAGIWAFDANNITFQLNESFANSTGSGKDGAGFDLDGGVTNSKLQWNYSHDNEGPGFLLASFGSFRAFGNNIVRNNISQNDARKNSYGAITLTGDSTLKDTLVENNTVYTAAATNGSTPTPVRVKAAGNNVSIRNNIFQSAGAAPVAVIDPAGISATFNGNIYYSSGEAFVIKANNLTYASLDEWRMTGAEMLGDVPTGLSSDPKLNAPGTAGMLLSSDIFNTLTQYQLQPGSPAVDAAIDLPAPWQNYQPAPLDFFGATLPRGAKRDIGAAEA